MLSRHHNHTWYARGHAQPSTSRGLLRILDGYMVVSTHVDVESSEHEYEYHHRVLYTSVRVPALRSQVLLVEGLKNNTCDHACPEGRRGAKPLTADELRWRANAMTFKNKAKTCHVLSVYPVATRTEVKGGCGPRTRSSKERQRRVPKRISLSGSIARRYVCNTQRGHGPLRCSTCDMTCEHVNNSSSK